MDFRHFKYCAILLGLVALQQTSFAVNPPLDQAREFAKTGNWEEVQSLAQQGSDLEPKNDEAWRLRGRAELFFWGHNGGN